MSSITQIKFFQEAPQDDMIHTGADMTWVMTWTFKNVVTIPRLGDKIHCTDHVLRTVHEVIWEDIDCIRIDLSTDGPIANND